MFINLILIVQLFQKSKCTMADTRQPETITFETIKVPQEFLHGEIDDATQRLNMLMDPTNTEPNPLDQYILEDEVDLMRLQLTTLGRMQIQHWTGVRKDDLTNFFGSLNLFTMNLIRKYDLKLDAETIADVINFGNIDMLILCNAASMMADNHENIIKNGLHKAEPSPEQFKEYMKGVTALLCTSAVLKNPRAYESSNLTPVGNNLLNPGYMLYNLWRRQANPPVWANNPNGDTSSDDSGLDDE
ncbi:uncharacterized protein VICG_00870 [Vittaforma corneae ATCC 50505]|uniref:Calponin-homology (CH) domain-containing protein n=1 Tax=Vittaforma corneae (strain ATCC 50505) TaxID=993615 RepID=L2GMA2_VITCO|nr:uncharacterized protein VICG_00870 [Vittaforma corneae ATCC 50505]ELA42023.1 hypothetical protein VICG_00870 [Vittaforma corneae ATCC 50505]